MSLIIPANTLSSGGFAVDNSCRFNDASPDILKNGTESDGNRKVWTMSMWIKRSKLGVRQSLWSWGSNSSSTGEIYIDANDFLVLNNDGQQGSSNEVEGVLRDTSAWYHIVWRCDVTETDNIDRWRVYINGVQRTLTDAATVTNADGEINKNATHENWIGGAARSLQAGNPIYPFGGYIAEAVFVDGQALAPTEFGEFDEDSGIWKPIDVSGLTFGNEGVYLNFQNAAELGTDVSGNGNTYAETGLTAIDQTTDTPTNNFATLNGILPYNTTMVLTEGNLKGKTPTDHQAKMQSFFSDFAMTQGKWYAEFKVDVEDTTIIGVSNDIDINQRGSASGAYNFIYKPYSHGYFSTGVVYYNTSDTSVAFGDSYTTGNIIGVALDLDNLKLYFSKNGVWQNSGDPTSGATGTGSTEAAGATALPAYNGNNPYFFAFCDFGSTNNTTVSANFGNPPFTISSGNTDGNDRGNFEYAVPSGYLSLCTANLSEVLG